jgi:hypothetical protein
MQRSCIVDVPSMEGLGLCWNTQPPVQFDLDAALGVLKLRCDLLELAFCILPFLARSRSCS